MLDDIRGYFMMVLFSLIDTRVARSVLGSSLILIMTVVSLRLFGGYVNAPRPTLYITAPQADAQISGTQVLVKGRVFPDDSEVTVNGQHVVANGDGTFSQIIQLSAGINVLKFEAKFYGKKSGAIQTATRILTEKEQAEQTAALLKEQEKVKQSADKLAHLTTTESVLGAETDVDPTVAPTSTPQADIETFVTPEEGMIATRKEIDNGKEKIVSGHFKNTTNKTLRWVKIKAEFKDGQGSTVESNVGAVTQVDQHLAPGAQVEYAVPAASVPYSTYILSVAYEAI